MNRTPVPWSALLLAYQREVAIVVALSVAAPALHATVGLAWLDITLAPLVLLGIFAAVVVGASSGLAVLATGRFPRPSACRG